MDQSTGPSEYGFTGVPRSAKGRFAKRVSATEPDALPAAVNTPRTKHRLDLETKREAERKRRPSTKAYGLPGAEPQLWTLDETSNRATKVDATNDLIDFPANELGDLTHLLSFTEEDEDTTLGANLIGCNLFQSPSQTFNPPPDDYHIDDGQPMLEPNTHIHNLGPGKKEKANKKRTETVRHWHELLEDPQRRFVDGFLKAEAAVATSAKKSQAADSPLVGVDGEVSCICMEPDWMSKHVSCVSLTACKTRTIRYCQGCSSLPLALLAHGCFPTSPSQPQVAFSFEVLKFYLRMDAIHKTPVDAFSSALAGSLADRGYADSREKPYYNQIQNSVKWFDSLLRKIECEVQCKVEDCPEPEQFTELKTPQSPESCPLVKGVASHYLRSRCPPCFGRRAWGGNAEISPDTIVCLDANFQQKHFSHVKEDPRFLENGDSHGWVEDSAVEKTRLEVEQAKETPATTRSRLSSTIPSKVLDECEESYKAAQEKMRAVDDDAFDSKGIMALVCVHDVPLLLADVKTRGEPRYLAISLLKTLSEHLPEHTTIGVMYDIGDQLDRTIEKYNILPDFAKRCSFAVALFHAFGHRVQCQVVYNPRYRKGFGLANGEGNERLWSLCRDLIGPQRVMGPHCRKMILARRMEHVVRAKAKKHKDYQRNMVERIKDLAEKSLATIRAIPSSAGEIWSKERLLQEFELKKRDLLNVKSYTETQVNSRVRSLLEATRNAGGTTRALAQIQKELRNEQYAQTLLPDRPNDFANLQTFVDKVTEQHLRSVKELEVLSDRLGLSTINVPERLPSDNQEYLKLLIALQVQKQLLWISLQNYQDERGPLEEASGRGGASGLLGTARLTSVTSGLKSKAQVVTHTVNKFNKIVKELRAKSRPAWVPSGLIPPEVEPEKLLWIKPDDPLWDEIFAGTPWFQDIENGVTSREIPAYAKSKEVCEGIVAALLLDRIEEQQLRIQVEQVNVINNWIYSLLKTWQCWKSHLGNPIEHRLEREYRNVLTTRPMYLQVSSKATIWAASMKELLEMTTTLNPSTLLHDMNSQEELLKKLDGLIRFPIESLDVESVGHGGDDGGEVSSEAGEDVDEAEIERYEEEAVRNLSSLNLEDDISQTISLPPARQLLAQVDGTQAQELPPNFHNNTLPSASVLIGVIDGQLTSDMPGFNFLATGYHAMHPPPLERAPPVRETRYTGTMEITDEMLKTLGESRHIHAKLVALAGKLFESQISECSLTTGAPHKLNNQRRTVANLNWTALSLADICRTASEAPGNGLWLTPIPLPGAQRKWSLGILHIGPRIMRVVCDFTPSTRESQFLSLLCKSFTRYWEISRDAPAGNWTIESKHRKEGEARYDTPSDSAIWVLADIQQLLLGEGLQKPSGFNAKEFRSQIREIFSTLPTTPINEKPIESGVSDSLSAVATEMMRLSNTIYNTNIL